jgi:hypothetical protein
VFFGGGRVGLVFHGLLLVDDVVLEVEEEEEEEEEAGTMGEFDRSSPLVDACTLSYFESRVCNLSQDVSLRATRSWIIWVISRDS